ncbi:MAG: TonB-dependent receptor [Halieaceae bacterium]|jgi:iron complex outermembrane recepter protein|nr:TonB-dependent receptor [Halieaceae bacterium]
MLLNPRFKIAPLAAAVATTVSGVPQSIAQGESITLEEVIVTARKRTESVQDIPSSIQAISGEDIKEMGARGMADYTRFMPSVNMIDYGSGSSSVIFRGATVDGGGYVAQATSSVYLDEVSVTSTGSQPAVRMVDIARVEALAGPQGAIYGSDAQAGTLRILTNKPVMNEFAFEVDASARNGSEGEASWDGSLVANLPIVDDTLALRLVAFGARDGGFIDNVYGHTPDLNVVNGPGYWQSGFGDIDNSKYVDKDVNDSEIIGWRAALKWNINENWSATLGALHQETDAGAYNFYDPYVGDLEKTTFFDDWSEDEYDLYSLTIEGDLGFAQLVAATSYYDRKGEYQMDITAYHHYWAGAYWSCGGAFDGSDLDPDVYYWYYFSPNGQAMYNGAYCLAPTADGDYLSTINDTYEQERFTQEIRLSSSGDTFDWLAGVYYEDSTNAWHDWFADVTDGNFQDSIAADYYKWLDGGVEHLDGRVAWSSDSSTDWEQYAVFGEVVWHATEKMDITFGGRYFDRENVNLYFVERPNSRTLPEYADGVSEHKGDETEFAPKISVSYNFTDDVMAYGLYTVGYRPGGTNRSRGQPFFPNNYTADEMVNYEIGIRSTIMDGAGRFNATAYYMDWEDYQLEVVDPSQENCPSGGPSKIPGVCGQPWQIIVGNAGDAHILGVNFEFDWAISENWLFGMNAEWLEAENDSDLKTLYDMEVEKGQELPTVADFSGSAWLNYERPIDRWGESMFARLQWSYRAESYNILETTAADGSSANPQLKNDASDIGDLIVGIRGETWEASLFVNNITDERAVFTAGSGAYEWGAASTTDGRAHTQKNYINRPREYGIRLIKRWGG